MHNKALINILVFRYLDSVLGVDTGVHLNTFVQLDWNQNVFNAKRLWARLKSIRA